MQFLLLLAESLLFLSFVLFWLAPWNRGQWLLVTLKWRYFPSGASASSGLKVRGFKVWNVSYPTMFGTGGQPMSWLVMWENKEQRSCCWFCDGSTRLGLPHPCPTQPPAASLLKSPCCAEWPCWDKGMALGLTMGVHILVAVCSGRKCSVLNFHCNLIRSICRAIRVRFEIALCFGQCLKCLGAFQIAMWQEFIETGCLVLQVNSLKLNIMAMDRKVNNKTPCSFTYCVFTFPHRQNMFYSRTS